MARRLPIPCYPRFLGVLPHKPPAHDLDSTDAQSYYAFVLGTFRAHRVTPVPEGTTLRAAYEHFVNVELQQMPSSYRDMLFMVLNNIQLDHDSKRRRYEAAIQRRAERRRKGLRAGSHDGGSEDSDADGELCDARMEAVADGSGAGQQDGHNGGCEEDAAVDLEVARYELDHLGPLALFDCSTDEGAYMYDSVRAAEQRTPLPDRFGEHNRLWAKRGSRPVKDALERACVRMQTAGNDAAEAAAALAADRSGGTASTRLRTERRSGRLVALVEQPGDGARYAVSELPAGTRPPLIKMARPPTSEEVVELFTLAEEQAFAFLIYADYFDSQRSWMENPQLYPHPGPPPRVVIVGKPGTGKSQIIHAGQWYTFQHGQPGWFATCAYAWTAALAFSHHAHRSLSTHSMFQLRVMGSNVKGGRSATLIKESDQAKLQVRVHDRATGDETGAKQARCSKGIGANRAHETTSHKVRRAEEQLFMNDADVHRVTKALTQFGPT